ncbi:Zinc finger fyve domain-containing protein 26 [Plakobranchus ocellatus]|uniref:Zinc finger fyve domain-containing protein 26 n=1 Tax=Plakobranchus ocellatus TaxID=259542 RepID=A0AAV4C3S0_9GAST|nr:Zinc finger fyve domain-containing protein 26 [Plakobranchus ocellatus]
MDAKDTVQKIVSEIIQNKLNETQDELLKSFCNNVFLGQWELARACLTSLVKEQHILSGHQVTDIVLKISNFPFSQSLGSSTVPTPHHLSWFCLQELKKFSNYMSYQDKAMISNLEQDVDFRLTLSLLTDAKDSCVQELYLFCKEHVLKEKVLTDLKHSGGSDFLSPQTLRLLRRTMLTTPSLGDSVLKGLWVEEETSENRFNERLHGISIECINSLLDEADERLKSGTSQDDMDSLLKRTLEILSYYNPAPYWNYIQIRQLFTHLLTMATRGVSGVLSAESIVSVICGRPSTYLLDEFCKIFHEVLLLATCNEQREKQASLTVDQQANLRLLTHLDRSLCWRDFFIICHKKSVHFLAEILDLCLALSNAGRFMELQDLLSYPEFHPLKPAVLLMGWSQCVTSAHARTLIDTLWDEYCVWPNQAMTNSCRSLAYHLDLMQWCLDRAKPLLEGSEINPSRQATQLLQGLETHSVLYMLHHSTSLAQLDHSEVLQLLNNLSVDKKAKSKKKAVTFHDDSKKASSEPINIEKEKDIAIFRSYCAIKNVMDALTFCVSKADHELTNPVQIKSVVSGRRLCKTFLSYQSLSSSEGDESSSPDFSSATSGLEQMINAAEEGFEEFSASYKEMVVKKLQMTREHLSLIQPMAYRLEVLENIFSLLFVTSADLSTEGSSIDMETDDENDSKQSSLDNITVDSLNISVVSEEDAPIEDLLSEKGKLDNASHSQAGSSVATGDSTQAPPSAGVEYDLPFIDSHQHHHQNPSANSMPTSELIKSAYFTPIEEQKRKAESMLRCMTPPRLTSRRRKRMSSDGQANDVVGFLANEYLTRDILNMLREALSDFNTAKLSVSGKGLENRRDLQGASRTKSATVDPLIEEALQTTIVTSIPPSSLAKRTTKLTQAIHEAWWRLQLVAHEAFPRQPGQLLAEPVYITDSEINFLPAWTCSTETGKGQIFSSWQASVPPHEAPQSNIISRMMASPESLLVLSLVKGNITQAAEVIKLFRLTDKSLETREVSFADLYRSSSESIWDLEVQGRQQSQTPPKVGKRSVKALSKAAAVGVATASLSHIVDDLLSSPSVPPIPKPRRAAVREKCLHLFNMDPPTALLLDLLCTSCHTWETCSNMLDIIKSKTRLLQQDARHEKHSSPPSEAFLKKSVDSANSSQSPLSTTSFATASPISVSLSGQQLPALQHQPASADSTLQNITGCSKLARRLHDLILMDESMDDILLLSSRHTQRGGRVSLQSYLHTAQTMLHPETLVKVDTAIAVLRRAVDQVMQVLSGARTGSNFDISLDESLISMSPASSYSGGSLSSRRLSSASNVSSASAKPNEDKHPLHAVVKFLMFSMEKYIPGEGLAHAHLSRSGMVATPPAKNYLLSLYDHVKEMAYLVAECESSSKDITNNYFKVLNDGPVNVLGRLMFVKKMPPAKLEAVAEKLSLNLTHTIVYSCCPKIPSKHPQALPQLMPETCVKGEGTLVMNSILTSNDCANEEVASNLQSEAMHHPEVLVRTILSQAVTAMEATRSSRNVKGIFDFRCAAMFVQTSEYSALASAVQSLKFLDLDLLKTAAEKVCFFVNLTNLMILHCNLSHIQCSLEGVLQGNEACNSSEKGQEKICPLSAADCLSYFCTFSYDVGQLGLVSMFDLLTVLCREGLKPSSRWKRMMDCRQLELSPEDPWKKYCPSGEPKLIFVINHGCVSSPPLQVLKPDTLEAQLFQTMKSYLSHAVSVSVEQERVSLPELLVWHEKDFVQYQPAPRETPHAALLRWLAQYVTPEKHGQLQQLFNLDSIHGYSENIDISGRNELPFKINIDFFDNTYSVAFNMSQVKSEGSSIHLHTAGSQSRTLFINSVQPKAQVSARSSAVSLRPPSSASNATSTTLTEFSGGSPSWSLEQPVYNLTPVTLEYVKQDSLLVATMVSLVCADNLDNIDQQFTDDHFNLTDSNSTMSKSTNLAHSYSTKLPMPHSSSDISLVDIRSYRYHRLTDDYPVLMRHLLHYILPLASADNPQLLEGRDPILKFVTNEIDDQVKLCMFSLPGSRQFLGVVHNIANSLLEERKWLELLNILHSLPHQVMLQQLGLQALHDHVLSSWALSEVKKPGYAPKIGDQLRKFYNSDLQARTVLSVSTALSKDLCLDLLDLCLTKLNKDSVVRAAVATKNEEVQIHAKIAENAKALRLKLSIKDTFMSSMSQEDQQLLSSLEEVTDWRQIPVITQKRPMDIMTLLEKAGDFQTAKQWISLHSMPSSYLSEIKKCQVTYLLREKGGYHMVLAFQELDTLRITSEQECLAVCKDLMTVLSNPQQIKFIVSFMLQYLSHCLQPHDLEELRLRRIGAKADLAGQIFEKIKADFSEVKEPKLRVAQDQFNNLLSKYANKAIEVNVVTVQESPTPSSASVAHGKSDKRSSGQKTGFGKEQSGKFIMPANPPGYQDWVPDSATSVCMVCQIEQFSMFNRRHHCRRCGRVVCASCSTKETLVFGIMARTCDECYEQIHNSGSNKAQEEHEIYSQKIRDSLSGSSPSITSTNSSTHAQSQLHSSMAVAAMQHVDHAWMLSKDVSLCDQVRSQFYYEQAPSVSLCVSILKQHSSRTESGKLILSMCDVLSSYMVPISPGVPNPEIDYSLIISVMKQLLFQAKIGFQNAGDSGMTAQCDTYLAHVDLLRVMVGAHFQDLPTIKELTKIDTVRRLRDKLIADERLSLAMEVSTKCGIDPTGVWSAMGFACLQLGDFTGARDKFFHCLKAPTDKNQTLAGQSRLIREILEFLDTIPNSGATEIQRLLRDPESICNIKTLLVPSVGEENRVESVPHKECMYYLRTYGTYMDHIVYLRQHNYWMKAVQFAINHHCSSDVFVTGLMVPAMHSGEMGRLLEQMLMLDPTLEKWTPYLSATCKHLLKKKYFYTLYQVQIFMKDYIRAAMTCISHFYQRGASSYLDLSGRMQYLLTAQQHLQAYLDPGQWGSVRHPLAPITPTPSSLGRIQGPSWERPSAESAARMVLTPDQVKK